MLQPKLNEPFNLENIFSTNNNWKHFDATKIINENNNGLTQKLDEFKGGKGTYIFWWTGTLEALNELNRKILLQGKKEGNTFLWHPIEIQTSWLVPIEIEGQKRYALYVGKSTTLRNRIRQHFHFSLEHDLWLESINKPMDKNDNSYFNLTGFKKHFDQ
ncbi:MAG: hypothetical protein EBU01_15705, partial [Crocinitomicaceae bacterium]|nr:hypothetical protein [Crocinitomicaceae bacterium]